ncbi:MAG TPA: squalene cyclase [Actinospica sp.]|jgi:hypothetical protein|nr:squalene cyclase [Actinospica sp.]
MDSVGWLLDGDPAIRWQVMRDITDAPAAEVEAERARVVSEGWGAQLLALQLPTGQWTAESPDFSSSEALEWWRSIGAARQGTLFPEGTSTTTSLVLLRDFGTSADAPAVRRAVDLVRERVQWEHEGEPYFEGETEPCINGRAVAIGAYFGQDVSSLVQRLLSEQMDDGGWNCEQENGSTRGSFHTTINVLEGLLEYEQAATDESEAAVVRAARLRGEEYLVSRGMLRRRSTGQVIDVDRKTEESAAWAQFSYPTFWHYDALRGLDYLRAAGALPDERLSEAVDLVESKRDADGLWALENPHTERLHFAMDEGVGKPSRWNTLRALRVLRWYGR